MKASTIAGTALTDVVFGATVKRVPANPRPVQAAAGPVKASRGGRGSGACPEWPRIWATMAAGIALIAVDAASQAASAQTGASGRTSEVSPGQPGAVGGGIYLLQRMAERPESEYRAMLLDLEALAWHVGSVGGRLASRAELRSVIGDLQEVMVAGRCRASADDGVARPCTFLLGYPDFAGVVDPNRRDQVLGWAGAGGALTLDVANTTPLSLRYFALLAPALIAGGPGMGAIALRYDDPADTGLPIGLDRSGALIILHNDRHRPARLETPVVHDALVLHVAETSTVVHDHALSGQAGTSATIDPPQGLER